MPSGTEWQKEIYLKGFAGKTLSVNIDLPSLEQRAKSVLTTRAFEYIAGGAGLGHTVSQNRSAFDQYKIIPRMLNDVSERDTSVNLFGSCLPVPLLLSPVGVLELAHRDADIAVVSKTWHRSSSARPRWRVDAYVQGIQLFT